MKNLKIVTTILFCLIAFSCKKDNNGNSLNTVVKFYSAADNASDAVMATVINDNSKLLLFGLFGSDGLHNSINSLILDNANNDFYTCLIFDNNKRPKVLYTSKRNNEKDNVILTFDYQIADTVVYNLYYYNWLTQEDSLLQQQKININNLGNIITYGQRSVITTPDYWNRTVSELGSISSNISIVFNTAVFIKNISTTKFNTNKISSSGVLTLQFLQLLDQLEQLAQINTTLNDPNNPVTVDDFVISTDQSFANLANNSPTAVSAIIPNPIGTPNYPVGITINWGISITGTDIDGQSPATGSINIRAANRNQVSISYSNSGSSNEVRQILLSNIPSTLEINANFNRSLYITIGPYLLAYPDSQNPDDIGKTSIYNRIYQ